MPFGKINLNRSTDEKSDDSKQNLLAPRLSTQNIPPPSNSHKSTSKINKSNNSQLPFRELKVSNPQQSLHPSSSSTHHTPHHTPHHSPSSTPTTISPLPSPLPSPIWSPKSSQGQQQQTSNSNLNPSFNFPLHFNPSLSGSGGIPQHVHVPSHAHPSHNSINNIKQQHQEPQVLSASQDKKRAYLNNVDKESSSDSLLDPNWVQSQLNNSPPTHPGDALLGNINYFITY